MNHKKRNVSLILIGSLLVILASLSGMLLEDVDQKKIIVNQYPWTGQVVYWTEPGVKWQGFGTTTDYYKTNQVWFNNIETVRSIATLDGKETVIEELIPGQENPALPITYADKGKGFVLGSVRIELPLEHSKLALIQQHYGNERRLIEELIKPTIGKVMIACGPLMTSLESVSEKRNDLVRYATDQLNYGIYATRAVMVERLNSITGEMEKAQQAEIITDTLGNPKRQEESPFDKYGLKVSQLAIADLRYEQATNNQIARQREADMDIISAKAEAAKAQQQTIKTEEEGKQRATAAKWRQEEINAKEIAEAEKAKTVSQLAAEKAEYDKKAIIAKGQADSEANRLKVQAGLTPQERAEWDYKTKVGIAKELAGYSGAWTPTVVSSGSNSGGATDPMNAVGLKMILDVIENLNK